MTLVKWTPMRELLGLGDDLDRWYDDFYTGGNRLREYLMPPLDIEERDKDFIVRTEVPGVPREGLNVTIENGMLTISGEKKTEHEEGKEGTKRHRIERTYGSFQRTLDLPDTVDREHVTGTLKDGVLTLTLQKKEQEKPKQLKVDIG